MTKIKELITAHLKVRPFNASHSSFQQTVKTRRARNPATPVYPPPRRTVPCRGTSYSARPAEREAAFSPAPTSAYRGHPPEVWRQRRSRGARRPQAQELPHRRNP